MLAMRRLIAEAFGTFWLVFCGCGCALIAASLSASGHEIGVGLVGVSLAFGLSVLTMAYAIGNVSGAHLNPAVTIGLATARRFPVRDVLPYIVAQLIGAIFAAFLLSHIMAGNPAFDAGSSRFASNGYGDYSPAHYSMMAAFLCEAVMTGFFVFVILGATDKRAPAGFAPIAIGLCLTLIHLVSIPITNTSVNPARSTGPALIAGGAAIDQLWLFWAAPILGAVVAGIVYPAIAGRDEESLRTPAVALELEGGPLSRQ